MKLAAILDRALIPAHGRPARLLALMWTIAAIPWLTWARTIPYDAKDEFYPGVAFTVKSLLRGEAPFWNPYLYSGYPSFADPQAMTFSPSVVLPMLVSQNIVWFDIVILVHVLLGGLGILRLGKSYDWKETSSLVAALVFMFGGVATSRLEHTPIIVTWAFLPWVFVFIRAVCETRSWRAAAGLGLALGLSTLQLTHVTYIFLLVIFAYSVYRLIGTARSEGPHPALCIGGRLVAGAALALLVAASIAGLNPMVLRDYVAFVGLGAEPLLPRSASGVFNSYHSRINDLLGVRYLATTTALRPTIEKELGSAYRVVAEPRGRVVWQNQNALPRVLRPKHAIPAPPLSAFAPATLDSIDLEQYAYIEASDDTLTQCAGGQAERGDIVRYSNNEVIVAVRTDRLAWVTLNDVFFEGWRAEIDGRSIPIYRANGIFRAVCVPPGRHLVRFVFEPYRSLARRLLTAVGP